MRVALLFGALFLIIKMFIVLDNILHFSRYCIHGMHKLYILSFNSFCSGYCTCADLRGNRVVCMRTLNMGWVQVVLCTPCGVFFFNTWYTTLMTYFIEIWALYRRYLYIIHVRTLLFSKKEYSMKHESARFSKILLKRRAYIIFVVKQSKIITKIFKRNFLYYYYYYCFIFLFSQISTRVK